MTHPTPEQERAAEERLRVSMMGHDFVVVGDNERAISLVRPCDLAILLSVVERQREAEEKYFDLLFQVINKIDGETRHETARRLINEAQNAGNSEKTGCAAIGESNDA